MTADDELPIIESSEILDDTSGAFLCKDPVQLKNFQAEIDHTNGTAEAAELLCVLAVIRHGDRTPKQKLKLSVRMPTPQYEDIYLLPSHYASFKIGTSATRAWSAECLPNHLSKQALTRRVARERTHQTYTFITALNG